MAMVEIESGDVVKLMLQFLKENNLLNTFEALQKETQVSLNTVDSVDGLVSDIRNGRWDAVLSAISTLRLPLSKIVALYEQIIFELIEMQDLEVARSLLRQTQAMAILKQQQPERYMRIDHMLTRGHLEPRDVWPGGNKDKRRAELSDEILKEIAIVPPSRLLTLLGDALKFQQLSGRLPPGSVYDLFRGKGPEKEEDETFPKRLTKTIKFGQKSHAEVARFSPDGQSLVTGSVDGFIEVWDYLTGALRKDLKYQAEDKFMMHDEAVLCLNFTKDGEHLVSGGQDAKIKVWNVREGRCLRKFDAAHSKGVTCVTFSKDGTQILSGSFDETVRLHGLKSGKTIKTFRGHTSYVNAAIFSADGFNVISASSDGTIRIWDVKSTDCINTLRPGTLAAETPISSIMLMPRNHEQIIVIPRSDTICVMNMQGQVIKSFSTGKKEHGEFVCGTVSPKGEWLYAVTEDKTLFCFSMATNQIEHMIPQAHEREVIGLHHHPHRNMLTSHADDGLVKLWIP